MNSTPIAALDGAILRALCYFELFSWPLTESEVRSFCPLPIELPALRTALSALIERGLVHRCGIYFQTKIEPDWAQRRQSYEARAAQYLPKARRMASFIGAFPFVKGVFVSGSLSKNSMPPDGDVDFFIVTAPKRLWLSRTLLVLFKKVLLLNSRKYFCINYFVDTDHLRIEEQNIFTATELVTLLPLYGREAFEDFTKANAWAWAFLPNCGPRPIENIAPYRRNWFKKCGEWLAQGAVGDWADRFCQGITLSFWRRKFKHLGPDAFDGPLKSRRYVSKHHPRHFQQKVLDALERRLKEIEN